MRTNQFRNLQSAALSVIQPKSAQLNENAQPEIIEEEVSEVPAELVEYVTSIIESAERQLKTNFTPQEIQETANFIIGKLQSEALIEGIEEAVGFELNEAEIQYVFNTIQNL
jgi:hypothetical protein